MTFVDEVRASDRMAGVILRSIGGAVSGFVLARDRARMSQPLVQRRIKRQAAKGGIVRAVIDRLFPDNLGG